jgi:hypothetical protein
MTTFGGIFTVPRVTAVGRRQTQEDEEVQSHQLTAILTDTMASSYGCEKLHVECSACIGRGDFNFPCGS